MGGAKTRQQLCYSETRLLGLLFLAAAWLFDARGAVAEVVTSDRTPTGAVTAKLMRYSERLLRRHDSNGDGHLDTNEWAAMRGQPATADLDGDGQLTVDEFARYAANYGAGRRIRLSTRSDEEPDPTAGLNGTAAPAGATDRSDPLAVDRRRDLRYFAPLPSGTPGWFVERDADGDAQLTLLEFSPRLRTTEVAEFKRYDVNGDGLLTAVELARSASKPAGAATPGAPASSATATP